jgi:prefoldin subunit 5
MENQLTPESLSQIMQILQDHFNQVAKSPQEAAQMIQGVAEMVKNPSNKLVHFDNVLFMVSVFKKHMIEFHAMVGGNTSTEEKIKELDEELPKFLKFLKKIEVKVAYTYMKKESEADFIDMLDRYKFTKEDITGPNGEELVAFYIEI